MIDLHSHTTASDGSKTPAELVRLAKEAGLSALAITDHDTVAGLAEAIAEGERLGIRVIPGVELSTKLDGHDVHIVGLFIDVNNAEFIDYINYQRDIREGRNLAMMGKIMQLFPDIELSDFDELDSTRVLTKGNFGEIIYRTGHADSVSDAIQKYLLKGGPAHVPRKHVAPDAAIDIIHKAGGKAILAHFNQIVRSDRDEAEAYARQIISMGVDGLETRYSEFDDDYRCRAENLAKEYGILRSGGSDFHGDVKPDIKIGVGRGDLEVPDEFLEKIEISLQK